MDKTQTIKRAFNILTAEFGEQTDYKKEIWTTILKDYSAEKIMEACIACVRTKRFFPHISEMLEIIEGNPESEAELAWTILKEKIKNYGHYLSVAFPENLVIGAVVEAMGGWIKINDTKEDEEKWVKKEFIKLYPILKKRGGYPDRLIGQFELDNSNKGFTEDIMLKRYGMHLGGIMDRKKKIETSVKNTLTLKEGENAKG